MLNNTIEKIISPFLKKEITKHINNKIKNAKKDEEIKEFVKLFLSFVRKKDWNHALYMRLNEEKILGSDKLHLIIYQEIKICRYYKMLAKYYRNLTALFLRSEHVTKDILLDDYGDIRFEFKYSLNSLIENPIFDFLILESPELLTEILKYSFFHPKLKNRIKDINLLNPSNYHIDDLKKYKIKYHKESLLVKFFILKIISFVLNDYFGIEYKQPEDELKKYNSYSEELIKYIQSVLKIKVLNLKIINSQKIKILKNKVEDEIFNLKSLNNSL